MYSGSVPEIAALNMRYEILTIDSASATTPATHRFYGRDQAKQAGSIGECGHLSCSAVNWDWILKLSRGSDHRFDGFSNTRLYRSRDIRREDRPKLGNKCATRLINQHLTTGHARLSCAGRPPLREIPWRSTV